MSGPLRIAPLSLAGWRQALGEAAPDGRRRSAGGVPACGLDPISIARRWPLDRPLLLLGSGRPHPRWSRWSILAEPRRWLVVHEPDPADALARIQESLDGTRRAEVVADSDSTLGADAAAARLAEADLPFVGGWIGFLGYELGRTIEPAVRHAASGRGPTSRSAQRPDGHTWPTSCLAHCPRALVHDRAREQWWSIGPGEEPPLEASLLGDVESAAGRSASGAWHLDPLESTVSAETWRSSVRRTIDLIHAGDIYQANVAHLLRSSLRGSPRALGLDALERVAPWHGALLELPDGSSLISLSPELFLAGEFGVRGGDGFVVTRPIKGTMSATRDASDLLRSGKDEAELVMIVDLMRNDLGRVCRAGSVRVAEQRHVEAHPSVLHGVATVEGLLRRGIDAASLLRSTFPPGSVTGAPKIRAMQVIEELEPWARGPYCGSIGMLSDHGRFALNVAIRTLAVSPPQPGSDDRRVHYGVGCGIVADSDADAEWQESWDKAAVVASLAAG